MLRAESTGWRERSQVNTETYPWIPDVVQKIRQWVESPRGPSHFIDVALYIASIVFRETGIFCTPIFWRILDDSLSHRSDFKSFRDNARFIIEEIAGSLDYEPETQKMSVDVSTTYLLGAWHNKQVRGKGILPRHPKPWAYLGKITGAEPPKEQRTEEKMEEMIEEQIEEPRRSTSTALEKSLLGVIDLSNEYTQIDLTSVNEFMKSCSTVGNLTEVLHTVARTQEVAKRLILSLSEVITAQKEEKDTLVREHESEIIGLKRVHTLEQKTAEDKIKDLESNANTGIAEETVKLLREHSKTLKSPPSRTARRDAEDAILDIIESMEVPDTV
jgi:hypothetical protein